MRRFHPSVIFGCACTSAASSIRGYRRWGARPGRCRRAADLDRCRILPGSADCWRPCIEGLMPEGFAGADLAEEARARKLCCRVAGDHVGQLTRGGQGHIVELLDLLFHHYAGNGLCGVDVESVEDMALDEFSDPYDCRNVFGGHITSAVKLSAGVSRSEVCRYGVGGKRNRPSERRACS